jgi:hypothetical protein
MPSKVFKHANNYLQYENYELNVNVADYSNIMSKFEDRLAYNKHKDPWEIENRSKCIKFKDEVRFRDRDDFNDENKEKINAKIPSPLARRFGCYFNVAKFRPVFGQYYNWIDCKNNYNESSDVYLVWEGWKLDCHNNHYWEPVPKKGNYLHLHLFN